MDTTQGQCSKGAGKEGRGFWIVGVFVNELSTDVMQKIHNPQQSLHPTSDNLQGMIFQQGKQCQVRGVRSDQDPLPGSTLAKRPIPNCIIPPQYSKSYKIFKNIQLTKSFRYLKSINHYSIYNQAAIKPIFCDVFITEAITKALKRAINAPNLFWSINIATITDNSLQLV